ncbi:MAG: ATP-binding protein [Bacteroidales bacterium]
MNIREIEIVVLDQKEELEKMKTQEFCHRPQEDLINMNSYLAQVVIGVRRSGKSTLCFNALQKAGVSYAYVNFDDEKLASLTLDDMDTVLDVLYRVFGDFSHLFLDEIQNIEGWHLFANRMLRKRIHLIITGSNSKLLSGELASHLTGRHHQIELFPFSFADYCAYNRIATKPLTTKNRGLLAGAFDRYTKQGGFPELLVEPDAKSYIDSLLHSIITQDIQKRFNIRYTDTLLMLVNHLLNQAPALIVKDTLQKIFGFKSHHTVGNYLSYLKQTYLISTISKYSGKSRQRTRNELYYPIDVAFMNNRQDAFSGENLGWRLETIVYLELRRRAKSVSQDIYYYDEGTSQADFIVCDGNRSLEVYQVTYSMEKEKTRKREIKGAVAGAKGTNCRKVFILTDHETETIEDDGYTIEVLPVWEWLLRQ